MTNLQSLAITGVLLLMATTTSVVFVSDGLSVYDTTSADVQDSNLNRLKNLTDVSPAAISDTAQTQAEGVNPKASFFTLPGLVSTFGIIFDIIPVLEAFAGTFITTFGLDKIPIVVQGVFAIIGIIVSFTFARRILG